MSHQSRFTLALCCGLLMLLLRMAPAAEFTPARVTVYFSPTGGATDAVVHEVNAATQQILVQAYSFTSAPIAKALVDAHKRGVKVLAVLDKSNETEKYPYSDTSRACSSSTKIYGDAKGRFPSLLTPQNRDFTCANLVEALK